MFLHYMKFITNEDNTFKEILPLCPEAKPVINKRVIKNFRDSFAIKKPVLPYIDIVHDRVMLELFRGCIVVVVSVKLVYLIVLYANALLTAYALSLKKCSITLVIMK